MYQKNLSGFNAEQALRVASRTLKSLNRNHFFSIEEIENFTQDTAIKAFEAWDRFDPERDFDAWVAVIARNHYLNEKKKSWRHCTFSLDAFPDLLDYSSDPEEIYLRNERSQAILSAISEMPADRREIVDFLADEKKPRHIAAECGCSANAASIRVSRVRDQITASLRGTPAGDLIKRRPAA